MLEQKILEANLELHAREAPHYDQIHREIFNPTEQHRLTSELARWTAGIEAEAKDALDVGCGTGNVSEKLLRLGFTVTGLDLSAEMLDRAQAKCAPLGEFRPYRGSIAQLAGSGQQYALVTAYSVVHHLPNYLADLKTMCSLVRPGGILYIDHEPAIPNPPAGVYQALKHTLIRLAGRPGAGSTGRKPVFDYLWSDYWAYAGLNWRQVEQTLRDSGLTIINTSRYLPYRDAGTARHFYPLFRHLIKNTRQTVAKRPH